jgi:hypothetical protein
LFKDKLFTTKFLKLLLYPSLSIRIIDFIGSFGCTFLMCLLQRFVFCILISKLFFHSTILGKNVRTTPASLPYQDNLFVHAKGNFNPSIWILE